MTKTDVYTNVTQAHAKFFDNINKANAKYTEALARSIDMWKEWSLGVTERSLKVWGVTAPTKATATQSTKSKTTSK